MSSPTGAPRRRKIAGERRPGRAAGAPLDGPARTEPGQTDATSTEAAPVAAPTTSEPTGPVAGEKARPRREKARPRREKRGAPDWWGSTPVVAALAVLCFALALAVVLGATGHLGNPSLSEAHDTRADAAAWDEGSSAPSTAERAAASILAYDYRSLEATEKEATQFMTSAYAKKYKETFEKVVMPAAKQQKAKVTADVQASSVVRATPGKVRVLLFVDQTTQSVANQSPQQALNRVEMVMVRQDGSWKVDSISSY